jgi:hypothetical protein
MQQIDNSNNGVQSVEERNAQLQKQVDELTARLAKTATVVPKAPAGDSQAAVSH